MEFGVSRNDIADEREVEGLDVSLSSFSLPRFALTPLSFFVCL